MTHGIVLVLVGLALCLAGVRSVRLMVAAGGFGAGWILSDVFGASTLSGMLIGIAGAAAALLVTRLLSRVLMFVVGGVVGAVVGAKLFVVLDGVDASWLLAVFFVPAFAIASGLLATRLRRQFLVWVTAFAGAAIVLSGLAVISGHDLALFRRPDDSAQSVIFAVAWVLLGLLGRTVQHRLFRGSARAPGTTASPG